ncbi:MAG: glycerol-3-phosphate 1-O-acyltransferase PlsY [Burkholderiaceae bacterium]
MAALIVAIGAGYLIGSVPFAVITSGALGLADPRTYGSGNPGATNVLRSGSKVAALLTLIGDAFKGWLAVWLASHFGPDYSIAEMGVACVAVAVFLGHLYPIFLRFRGGKGVATAAGAILALNPWLAVAAAITWLVVAALYRYSSLASIAAAVLAPFYSAFGWGFDALFVALVVIAAFIVYRHRTNIRNLSKGTERRIGLTQKTTAAGRR